MNASPRIRLLISDVDGTLLSPGGELSPVTYITVARLQQAGVKFALSSSRPSFGMEWLVRMLDVRCTCSGLNGAILFYPDGSTAAERELDRSTVEEMTGRMLKRGLDVWLYTRDHWFVPRLGGPHVRHNAESLRTDPKRYLKIAEVSDPILKVVGTSEGFASVAACECEFRKDFANRVAAVRSQPHYLDLTHPSVDKGQAAVSIAITEGILMDEVAAVGDSPADIPMFQAAGLGIAMGQAAEEVRRAAMQITRSNTENGLAWAIEYVLSGKWCSNGAGQGRAD